MMAEPPTRWAEDGRIYSIQEEDLSKVVKLGLLPDLSINVKVNVPVIAELLCAFAIVNRLRYSGKRSGIKTVMYGTHERALSY